MKRINNWLSSAIAVILGMFGLAAMAGSDLVIHEGGSVTYNGGDASYYGGGSYRAVTATVDMGDTVSAIKTDGYVTITDGSEGNPRMVGILSSGAVTATSIADGIDLKTSGNGYVAAFSQYSGAGTDLKGVGAIKVETKDATTASTLGIRMNKGADKESSTLNIEADSLSVKSTGAGKAFQGTFGQRTSTVKIAGAVTADGDAKAYGLNMAAGGNVGAATLEFGSLTVTSKDGFSYGIHDAGSAVADVTLNGDVVVTGATAAIGFRLSGAAEYDFKGKDAKDIDYVVTAGADGAVGADIGNGKTSTAKLGMTVNRFAMTAIGEADGLWLRNAGTAFNGSIRNLSAISSGDAAYAIYSNGGEVSILNCTNLTAQGATASYAVYATNCTITLGKVSSPMAIAGDLKLFADTTLNFSNAVALAGNVSNAGTMTFDLTGETSDKVTLIDYAGSETMDLAKYGTVELTNAEGYTLAVDGNDLVATKAAASNKWTDYAAASYATPIDTVNKVVTIASAAELALFAKGINDRTDAYDNYTVNITADIDLSAHEWVSIKALDEDASPYWNALENVVINGNHHTISGLTIDQAGVAEQGLIGVCAEKVTVKDLTIADADVTCGTRSGIVVGTCYGVVTVAGVTVTNSTLTGKYYDGALIGFTGGNGVESFVSNCVCAAVTVTDNYAGAYCGTMVGLVNDGDTIRLENNLIKSDCVCNELRGSFVGVSYNDNYAAVPAAAQIGDWYYPSLSTAIAAVEQNGTITILADSSESFTATPKDGVTAFTMSNAGGYALSGTVTTADGYAFTVNGDGTCTYGAAATYVAEVLEISGATTNVIGQYETVNAAFGAVQDGQTILMLADAAIVEEGIDNGRIRSSRSFTLDLNGRTIDGDGKYGFYLDGAAVTIKDSSGDNSGKIANCSNANTSDADGGGAIEYGSAGGTLTITGGTFCNNTAQGSGGGAICAPDGGNILMTGGVISGNAAVSSSGNGGAVNLSNGGTFMLDGGVIRDNAATNFAGAVQLNTGAKLVFESGELVNNKAYNMGGAIYTESSTSFITIHGGYITNNWAKSHGGGIIYQGGAALTMTSGCVSFNTSSAGHGGGIYSRGPLAITGGEITGNSAGSRGGGIWMNNASAISNCLIAENTAASTAGGIQVSGGTLTLGEGVVLSGNKGVKGGGVEVESSSAVVTVNGAQFLGNDGLTGDGGAIFINNGTVNFFDGFIDEDNKGANKYGNGQGIWAYNNLAKAKLNISGGTFDASIYLANATTGSAITGGKFSKKIIGRNDTTCTSVSLQGGIFTDTAKTLTAKDAGFSKLVASGKSFVVNTDPLTCADYPWMIGAPMAAIVSADGATTNVYATLSVAFGLVENRETIRLLADNDEVITTTITATDFTFDPNGKSLTGSVQPAEGYKFFKVGDVCYYLKEVDDIPCKTEEAVAVEVVEKPKDATEKAWTDATNLVATVQTESTSVILADSEITNAVEIAQEQYGDNLTMVISDVNVVVTPSNVTATVNDEIRSVKFDVTPYLTTRAVVTNGEEIATNVIEDTHAGFAYSGKPMLLSFNVANLISEPRLVIHTHSDSSETRYVRGLVASESTFTYDEETKTISLLMSSFSPLVIRADMQVGDDAWATLTDDGTCTITGTGAMWDFTSKENPIDQYWSDVKRIVIAEGVTTLGAYTCYKYYNLTNVTVAASCTTFGEGAIFRCLGLESMTFQGSSLPTMGTNSLNLHAAIRMEGSTPVIYAVPEITVGGNAPTLKATNDLSDPNSWVTIEPGQEKDYHFFKLVIGE